MPAAEAFNPLLFPARQLIKLVPAGLLLTITAGDWLLAPRFLRFRYDRREFAFFTITMRDGPRTFRGVMTAIPTCGRPNRTGHLHLLPHLRWAALRYQKGAPGLPRWV